MVEQCKRFYSGRTINGNEGKRRGFLATNGKDTSRARGGRIRIDSYQGTSLAVPNGAHQDSGFSRYEFPGETRARLVRECQPRPEATRKSYRRAAAIGAFG